MTARELEEVSKAAAAVLRKDGFASDREFQLAHGVVALLGERDVLITTLVIARDHLEGGGPLTDKEALETLRERLAAVVR